MSMKTCKTCAYWGRARAYIGDTGQRLKTCSAPAVQYGYCVEEADVASNGARVEDDEGWGMVTGPEFGCVHHTERPA